LDEKARSGACSQQGGRFQQVKTGTPVDCSRAASVFLTGSMVTVLSKAVICFSSASSSWQDQCSHTDEDPVQACDHLGFQLWDVGSGIPRGGKDVTVWL